MAPRFVEVSTPVEDSVHVISRFGNWFVNTTSNASYTLLGACSEILSSIQGVKLLTEAAESFPWPRGVAYYMILASVALIVFRIIFVSFASRRILYAQGHSRLIKKSV